MHGSLFMVHAWLQGDDISSMGTPGIQWYFEAGSPLSLYSGDPIPLRGQQLLNVVKYMKQEVLRNSMQLHV